MAMSIYSPKMVAGFGKKSTVNGYKIGGAMNLDGRALFYHNKDNLTKGIESLSEMVDRRYKIVDDAELSKCVLPTRNSSYEKDAYSIDNRRVYAGSWMESSNKLLDVGETEHAGAKMNNYEEKMIPDRTDRLDAEIKFTGLIFMCNKQTMEDCFTYSLFGLPFNRWRLVKQIVPGTALFLFEYEERQLWGIYEATSYGQLNIEPSAYKHSKGSFPAQVQIKVIEKCPPLKENEFKRAIIDNYWSDMKFDFALSRSQVQRLMLLFLRTPVVWNMWNETTCGDFCPDDVNEVGDWIKRSNGLHDFEIVEVEKCSSIESNRRSLQNSSVEDISCSGKENRLLLKKKASEFSKGTLPGTPPTFATEKTWNGIHLNAYPFLFPPLNGEVDFLNVPNIEELSIDHSRSMPLVDIYHSNGYAPLACTEMVDTSQQMCEQRIGKDKKILSDGLELLRRNEVNHKSSVWYRLSSGIKASHLSPSTLNTGKALETSKCTTLQAKPEKLVTSNRHEFDRTDTSNNVTNSSANDFQPLKFCRFNMEESSLRVISSKREDNLDVQNISVCREQNPDTNLESSHRSGGALAEKGSCSGFDIEVAMARELAPSDVFETQYEPRVSNCPIVIDDDNLEKQSNGRAAKPFHEFSILSNADKSVLSQEDAADKKGGVGLFDLNQPFCPENEEGIDNIIDVKNCIICNDSNNPW